MAGKVSACYGSTAFTLAVLMCVTCVIAFVVPHWLVSWEQKQSTFTRIGLWEVCLTAFTDPQMYAYKYYSGCWWIFHPEVDAIREMLNPDWFKAVQAFSVITLFTSFISAFFLLFGRCTSYKGCSNTGGAAFAMITVITSGICVMVFGACARDPRQYRLPMPQYNYLGAGFGMMILCCLFAGFCFAFVIGDINTSKREEEENEKYRR